MRARRPLVAGLVLMTLMAACGGDAGESTERPPFAPPPTGVWQPSADCDLAVHDEYLDAQRQALVRSPRAWVEVDAAWTRWAIAAEALRPSRHVDGAKLDLLLEALDIGRGLLRDAWGVDGSELLSLLDGGDSLMDLALPEGTTSSNGTSLSPDRVGLRIEFDTGINAECRAAPPGWTEVAHDDDLPIPPGRLLMVDVDDPLTPVVRALPSVEPEPWVGDELAQPSPSPDGERLFFFREGSAWVGTPDGVAEIVVGGPGQCHTWERDSQSLVRLDEERRVERVSASDGAVEPIEVEPGDVCVVDVGQGRYVTTSFTDEPQQMALWVQDEAGERRELLRAACTLIVDAPAPVDGIAAVVARCIDPYQDGLWHVDVESGVVDHVVTGLVTVSPSYSPDGRWLAFGSTATWRGRADEVSVWLQDLETGAARRVSPDGFTLPSLQIAPRDVAPA